MTGKTLKQRQAETGRTLALNGAKWRKLRAFVLRESPICEHCAQRGLVEAATDVDHIDNDPTNNSMANLSSLCASCHSQKTQADMGKRTTAKGCDMDGLPTDPSHPWNQGVIESPQLEEIPRQQAKPDAFAWTLDEIQKIANGNSPANRRSLVS